jgi:hypothetical protein
MVNTALLARLGHGAMSGLSPQNAAKRTWITQHHNGPLFLNGAPITASRCEGNGGRVDFHRGRVPLLVQSLAEQDDSAASTLFPAGSAVARHPARNNREAIFFAEDDYACYRHWLAAAAAEYGCAVHAHVLMTNPLLVTPGGPQSLLRTMQSLGRRTIRHINAADRQGSRSSRRSAAGLRRCRRADRRGGSRIDGS